MGMFTVLKGKEKNELGFKLDPHIWKLQASHIPKSLPLKKCEQKVSQIAVWEVSRVSAFRRGQFLQCFEREENFKESQPPISSPPPPTFGCEH